MKIIVDKSLSDFKFWSGGKDRADKCSNEEFEAIESFLEEIEPEEGWSDTAINDMFWFEFDTIAQHLGYEDEDDFDQKHDPNYADDDELEEYVVAWFRQFLASPNNHEEAQKMMDIYCNLFDGDLCELAYDKKELNEAEGNVMPMWAGKRAFKYLMCLEACEIMESLFDDDRGAEITGGEIPTKEEFRAWVMKQKCNNINNSGLL